MGKITEFLETLGNTSEEIAKTLESKGITGQKRNPEFCPIIKAIYQEFPNMSRGLKAVIYKYSSGYRNLGYYGKVFIEGYTAFKLTWNDCQTMDPSSPEVIGKFVEDFDNGKYPHLVGKSQKQIKEETLAKLTKEEKMALGL